VLLPAEWAHPFPLSNARGRVYYPFDLELRSDSLRWLGREEGGQTVHTEHHVRTHKQRNNIMANNGGMKESSMNATHRRRCAVATFAVANDPHDETSTEKIAVALRPRPSYVVVGTHL
jgi:hypothetical protein